jgi:hypothetical protein
MNNDHNVNIQLHMCQVPRFKLNCKKKRPLTNYFITGEEGWDIDS